MNKHDRRPDVRINVPLVAELHTALRVQAVSEGVSLQELVERLLCEAKGIPAPDRQAGKKGGLLYPFGGTAGTVFADAQR